MSNDKKVKALVATINASVSALASNVSALAALVGGASEAASDEAAFPSAKEIAKLKGKKLTDLAKSLNIETDDVEEDALKATITLVAKFKADADSLTEKELVALAKGLGLKPSKKADDNKSAISEYLSADVSDESSDEESEDSDEDSDEESDDADEESDEDSEDEETEESDDEESDDSDDDEETEEESDDEESDDEDSDEDSDDDESEEESDEDESEDEESDEDESEDSDDEESDDEEESDEDESDEDESDDEDSDESEDEVEITKKDLEAYNAKAKKKLKTADELKKLLTDDDGVVHPMGEAYFRKEVGYCCGVQLADTDNEGEGKCVVTGKVFTVNDDGALVEKKSKKK